MTSLMEKAGMDVALAVQRLKMDGYVIVPDLLPVAKVDRMRERFLELLDQRARGEPSNRGANRYQMYVPFENPFDDPELYYNPLVMEILRSLMGADLICTYLASD